jgi:hypothetical protein
MFSFCGRSGNGIKNELLQLAELNSSNSEYWPTLVGGKEYDRFTSGKLKVNASQKLVSVSYLYFSNYDNFLLDNGTWNQEEGELDLESIKPYFQHLVGTIDGENYDEFNIGYTCNWSRSDGLGNAKFEVYLKIDNAKGFDSTIVYRLATEKWKVYDYQKVDKVKAMKFFDLLMELTDDKKLVEDSTGVNLDFVKTLLSKQEKTKSEKSNESGIAKTAFEQIEFPILFQGNIGKSKIDLGLSKSNDNYSIIEGYNIVNGNKRPISGFMTSIDDGKLDFMKVQKSGEEFIVKLQEPGDHKFDGSFDLRGKIVAGNLIEMDGVWKMYSNGAEQKVQLKQKK